MSRALYEHLHMAREETLHDLSDAQAEVRRLTDVIIEMRREGFSPSPRPESYGPTEPDLPDGIVTEIEKLAPRGANPDLWRQLMRGARQELRADHSNAEDVARRIRLGGEPEED